MDASNRFKTQHSEQAITASYQACLDLAQQQATIMGKRWYTRLAEKLLDKSTTSMNIPEKRQIHESWVALTAQQAAIEQGFPLAFSHAVAQDLRGGDASKPNQPARSLSSLKFGDLELMGDVQVQETLDEARLQQVLLLASDAGFTGFSARLSTAQGFKTVKADKNPLRPEIIARALVNTLQNLPAEPEARSRWLVYGGPIMGEQLQLMYSQLQDLLEKQGVKEASYKVTSAPDEPGRGIKSQRDTPAHALGNVRGNSGSHGGAEYQGEYRGAYNGDDGHDDHDGHNGHNGHDGHEGDLSRGVGDSGASSNDFESAPSGRGVYLSREKLLTLDHLHRLMSGEYDEFFTGSVQELAADAAANSLTKNNSPSMSAALGLLAELEKEGAGNKDRKNARPMPPVPVALVREQLKSKSRSLGQSLAIEVVGLMIEQLSTDARLLAPVRQVIANAEPAFLRMGMSDPRFFSDKNHPARRLLEAITAKSLAFDHEDAAGFADFMRDLQNVASHLMHEQADSAQHFEMLLQDFEARHAERNKAAHLAQKKAVQALLQAEQRNLLAEKIGVEIRQRSDFVPGNPVIAAFITGPWAQIMAKERLLGEHGDLGQRKAVYSLALGDLLWSIDFAQASRFRKRLVKIIPDLLHVLREGLLSIDYPLAQSKGFFDELMRLHEQSLTATAAPVYAQRNKLADLEKAFAEGDVANKTQPWLDPTEAQQSGFMDYAGDTDKPTFEATMPQTFDDNNEQKSGVQPAFDAAENMRPGAWVELLANEQWVRAQLTWISPHNTLFMFTSSGGRSHSMTSRMLEQLIGQGRFKLISMQGVLDGAFDNVAQTAMRNSVQG